MERNDGKKGGCKGYGFVMFEDPAVRSRRAAGAALDTRDGARSGVCSSRAFLGGDCSGLTRLVPTRCPLPAAPRSRRGVACACRGCALLRELQAAAVAIKGLTDAGTEAAYARLSTRFPATASSAAIREDPTNLYFSNLPTSMNEAELEALLVPYGEVVSSRILREHASEKSRGVGFARMTSREHCLAVIGALDGQTLGGRCIAAPARAHRVPGRRLAPALHLAWH